MRLCESLIDKEKLMGCLIDLVTLLFPQVFGSVVGRGKPWWVGGVASIGCTFSMGLLLLLLIYVATHAI